MSVFLIRRLSERKLKENARLEIAIRACFSFLSPQFGVLRCTCFASPWGDDGEISQPDSKFVLCVRSDWKWRERLSKQRRVVFEDSIPGRKDFEKKKTKKITWHDEGPRCLNRSCCWLLGRRLESLQTPDPKVENSAHLKQH